MNKRLLAGLMAFCLAAGAANAAFAEDPPLSGPLHTEIATSETAAPAEPTPVPPGPAGENTTGDELYTPTPSTTPTTTATPESADPPDDEDEPAVQAVTLRSVKMQRKPLLLLLTRLKLPNCRKAMTIGRAITARKI